MNNAVTQRIKLVISWLISEGYAKNQEGIGNLIGITSKSYLSQLVNCKADNKQFINKLSELDRRINVDWILNGKDEMLKPIEASSLPQPRKKIPVYDSQTIGGLNGTVANVDDNAKVSEEIDAGDWFPEATAAMHHYGDSMVEYPSGSILALKRVNDKRLIINGRNYVIETTEFRVTKQLQYDGGDVIMAYSSNTETYPDGRQIHSPIKIPVETVRHIDLVLGCVTKEYSNGAVIIRKR